MNDKAHSSLELRGATNQKRGELRRAPLKEGELRGVDFKR